MGTKGNYQGKEIYFLLIAPDEVVGVGFINAQSSATTLKIKILDAPNLKVGDEITSENMTFKIIAEPKKDLHRLIWSAEVSICD